MKGLEPSTFCMASGSWVRRVWLSRERRLTWCVGRAGPTHRSVSSEVVLVDVRLVEGGERLLAVDVAVLGNGQRAKSRARHRELRAGSERHAVDGLMEHPRADDAHV